MRIRPLRIGPLLLALAVALTIPATADAARVRARARARKVKPAKPRPVPTTAGASTAPTSPPASPSDAAMQLGAGLLRSIAEPNAIVSPLSLHAALTLVSVGAGGSTRSELERALALSPGDPERASIQNLLRDITALDPQFSSRELEVKLANGLWVQTGLTPAAEFSRILDAGFRAPVQPLDFARPDANEAIDAWASDATNRHITKVFGSLSPATRAVLANALYMKATWVVPADPTKTTSRPFTRSDRKVVAVPMMQLSARATYAEIDGVRLYTLPYRGPFEMVVATTPDPARLASLLPKLARSDFRMHVTLPRFEIRSGYDLKTLLPALGLGETFGSKANFARMGLGPLTIDQAVQKVWVKTDEVGTEGAAVTGMSFAVSAPPAAPDVTFDTPFTFAVRHSSGMVLFLGRVGDPSAPAAAS